MTKNSSIILNDAANIFDHEKPDLVLLMADRYEVLPVAIAASYQNIPLAHIQGGEVTGNIDEKVRHSISKLADLHFVSNSKCKKMLFNWERILILFLMLAALQWMFAGLLKTN